MGVGRWRGGGGGGVVGDWGVADVAVKDFQVAEDVGDALVCYDGGCHDGKMLRL